MKYPLNKNVIKFLTVFALASTTFACTTTSDSTKQGVRYESETFTNQLGIQTEGSSDTGGGENIGYIEPGDWVEYKINVPVAGEYKFTARVASDTQGGDIVVLADGAEKVTIKIKGTGGWQSWESRTGMLNLDAGTQTIRFNFEGESGFLFNMNWFELSVM